MVLRGHYQQSNGCNRWYFTFNGQECVNPGPIEYVVYSSASQNYYRPSDSK